MKNSDEYDTPAEVLGDIIEDPETKGVKFISVSDAGEVVTWGISDGGEKTMVELAAAGLLHSAREVEGDETEFIKKVVNEYNDQKKTDVGEQL